MIKKRNPIFVIVVGIITLGIYGLYWFYSTSKELIEATGSTSNPVLWLVGMFVPLVNFYVLWKYSGLVEKFSKGKQGRVLIFVVWMVFAPVALYLIQTELNKQAKIA